MTPETEKAALDTYPVKAAPHNKIFLQHAVFHRAGFQHIVTMQVEVDDFGTEIWSRKCLIRAFHCDTLLKSTQKTLKTQS